jgi:hypothetical protein
MPNAGITAAHIIQLAMEDIMPVAMAPAIRVVITKIQEAITVMELIKEDAIE